MGKMELYKNMKCYDDWKSLINHLNSLRSCVNVMVIMENNHNIDNDFRKVNKSHFVDRQRKLEIEHDKLIDNIFNSKPYWLANEITSNLLEWKYIN